MQNPPPLTISPVITPSSGVGSDIHGQDIKIGFGDISTGGGSKQEWWQKAARDAAVGLVVAVVARYVFQRMF